MKINPLDQEGGCADAIDLEILGLLQENCKRPLAEIGKRVGLSAPSVVDRIRKLEERGVITSYTALLDARRLGLDITGFIGVSLDEPKLIESIEKRIVEVEDVLECHHVTGGYTLLLKVKTRDTASLEFLIGKIRSIEGVTKTETMIVLSTNAEKVQLCLSHDRMVRTRRIRQNGISRRVRAKGDRA